jgi:hypothetical protein
MDEEIVVGFWQGTGAQLFTAFLFGLGWAAGFQTFWWTFNGLKAAACRLRRKK